MKKKLTWEGVRHTLRACGDRIAAFRNKYPVAALGVWALLLTLTVECLSRRSLFSGLYYAVLHPYLFLYNALIVFALLSPALLGKRRIFWGTLLSSVWLILGVANFIMLGMRTTPISAIDLSLLISCFPILNVYLSLWQIILIAVALLLLVVLLVLLFLKTPKQKMSYKKSVGTVLASALSLVLFTAFSLHIGAVSTKFPNLPDAYDAYGFPYCFSLSLIDRGVSRPSDYSDDRIEDILSSIETEEKEEHNTPEKDDDTLPESEPLRPSIIFVQLESFFDVNRIPTLSYSENPLPVFSALKESTISGLLSVPSIGAGTANTEFEVLTGMNLDDFGAGEYPYKTILRQSCTESIAYNLKELGYTSHAMHNNGATFYDRHLVYPSLGFDTFVPLEHMQNVEYNPLGWAKDMVLADEILTCLEATDTPDLVFAVSVQPHGKYPEEEASGEVDDAYDLGDFFDDLFPNHKGEEEEEDENPGGHTTGNATTVLTPENLAKQHISVSGIDDPALRTQYTYFVNQIYETDAFLGALLAAFDAYDEPVMLVLYGDHLPALEIPGDALADGSSFYQTDYAIWTNYEQNEPQQKDLEAFQLAAYALELADIHEGLITSLHQTMAEKEDYLAVLELLEYDMLYGEHTVWDGVNPYLPTNMQFGVREISVTNVYRQQEESRDFYVTGENFTPFSRVLVNGKRVRTEFLSDTMLLATDRSLSAGDRIVVAQLSSDGTKLSESAEYVLSEK